MASSDEKVSAPNKRAIHEVHGDIMTWARRAHNRTMGVISQFIPVKEGSRVVIDPEFAKLRADLAELQDCINMLTKFTKEYEDGL